MLNGVIKSIGDTAREFAQLEKLFAPENKDLRRLVFFGESPIQYRYYEDYIEYILKHSKYDICYIASDPADPIFNTREPRIKPFFIKNALNTAFARLDAKVLVISTPDLNKGAVKRAPDSVHHVYAFRGIASVHQGYRLGAFDNYDALLCIAPYQVDEVRKTEELYKLKPKALPVVGYPLVERLYREHEQYKMKAITDAVEDPEGKLLDKPVHERRPVCLVAPTWDPFGRASIFDACASELIEQLAATRFDVWLRPHPEFVKRYGKKMEAIANQAYKTKNVTVQTELASMECLHRADILVTDHSSISMDYVLATERPVLFINTPGRIDNPEWPKLGLEPVENQYRSALGAAIDLDKLNTVAATIEKLFSERDDFKERVPVLREKLLANWQQAAEAGGKYILEQLNKGNDYGV